VAVGGALVRDHRAGTDARAAAEPDVPGAAELEARARPVFEALNGTAAQNTASGVLRAWALNGAMGRCMADHGHPEWDWSRGHSVGVTLDPLGSSTFFARPLGRPYSGPAVETRAGRVAEEALMAEEPGAAEDAAIDECLARTPPASDAAVGRASEPPGARRLREAWWALMHQLDDRFGDAEAHHRCLEEADLSFLAGGDDVGEVGEALATLVPGSRDVPAPGADPATYSAAWRRLLAAEEEYARADWACRSATYRAHLEAVTAAVDRFATAHAGELDQVRRGWAEVEERAEALGLDPRTGQVEP
jgi:hypothetical protein